MKRLLIIAALMALFAPVILAGSYKVVQFPATGIGTTTAETSVVKSGITGKLIAFSYYSLSNQTVRLETVPGSGMSTGGIRTVSGSTNAAGGFYHYLEDDDVYLYNDRVRMQVHSSGSGDTDGIGKLLLLK
jgi:hypothetical protein